MELSRSEQRVPAKIQGDQRGDERRRLTELQALGGAQLLDRLGRIVAVEFDLGTSYGKPIRVHEGILRKLLGEFFGDGLRLLDISGEGQRHSGQAPGVAPTRRELSSRGNRRTRLGRIAELSLTQRFIYRPSRSDFTIAILPG